MGSIVSVKQRARKKTVAITAFGSHLFVKQQPKGGNNKEREVTTNHSHADFSKRIDVLNGDKFTARTGNGEFKDNVSSMDVQEDELENKRGKEGAKQGEFDDPKFDIKSDEDSRKKQVEFDREDKTAKATVSSNERLDTIENSFEVNDPLERDAHPGITDQRGGLSNDEEANLYYSLSSTPDSLCQGRPRDVKPRSPTSNPVNKAFSSWGEGVVGTSLGHLDPSGRVTSRGLDVTVKRSADHYDDYAYVRSYKSPTPEAFPVKSHQGECKCKQCIERRKRETAAVRIQSHLRGYQARKEMLKTRKSVVKIQRIYRARVQKRLSTEQLNKPPEKDHLKTGRTPSPNASQGAEIGEETKESFELYQDDITELKWKSQQLIETATMGEDYEPQKILLISSNIQRPEWLARVTLQDVHVIMYQFSQVTLKDILDNISLSLDDYRVGSKAKRIAFVCQGGPGYVYICRGKVLTSKKLGKDRELRDFVRQLGNFISKKDPSNAKVHFIGSNVLGNKQGVTLLEDVQKYMHPARVTVESPFEISECGFEMLNEYFNIDLYNIWKKSRFTRMKIVGV